jgi:hypothetical protein
MLVLADAGLPMIFIELPLLVLALVPIVLLEALVYRAGVALPWCKAVGGSLVANLCSTFLGVPIAWAGLLVGQLAFGGGSAWGLDTPLLRLAAVTVQAPWLIPYEREFYWMIPAASLFLMLPFFLVSVLSERYLLLHWWPEADRRRLSRFVWLANLASYTALAGYWAWRLAGAAPWPIT